MDLFCLFDVFFMLGLIILTLTVVWLMFLIFSIKFLRTNLLYAVCVGKIFNNLIVQVGSFFLSFVFLGREWNSYFKSE